jgi:catechol 2,3-dioxygenase-like lactoylglutathione lyase family enzyme
MPAVTPLFNNELFSHGTYECNDMAATRRFLVDFLGLDLVRPLPEAQYMWKGGPWSVVCVCVRDGEAKEQGVQNHFKLSVAAEAEVDAARSAALAHRDDYGIKRVLDVETVDGHRAFKLLDLNNTWWEISTVSQAYFDDMFARGDAARESAAN